MQNLLNIDFIENGVSSINKGNSVELIIKPLENQKTNYKIEITTSSVYTHQAIFENEYIRYNMPFQYYSYKGTIKIRLLSSEGNTPYITITNKNNITTDNNIIIKYNEGNYELSIVKKQDTSSVVDLIYPIGSVITNSNSDFNPNTIYVSTVWERIKGKVIVGIDENDSDFNTTGKSGGAKTHTLTNAQMPSHTHTQNAHTHTQNSHNHSASIGAGGSHNHTASTSISAIGNHQHGILDADSGSTGAYRDWVSTINNIKSSFKKILCQPDGSHNHGATTTISSGGSHSHSTTINGTTATNDSTIATNKNTGGGQAHNNLQPYITKYVWERIA